MFGLVLVVEGVGQRVLEKVQNMHFHTNKLEWLWEEKKTRKSFLELGHCHVLLRLFKYLCHAMPFASYCAS